LRALCGIAPELQDKLDAIGDVREDEALFFQILNWKDSEHKFDVCDSLTIVAVGN
jgi:hypothetical protein